MRAVLKCSFAQQHIQQFDMAHEPDNEHDSDGTHESEDDNTAHDLIARAAHRGIERGTLPRSVETQRASVLRSAQEDAENGRYLSSSLACFRSNLDFLQAFTDAIRASRTRTV